MVYLSNIYQKNEISVLMDWHFNIYNLWNSFKLKAKYNKKNVFVCFIKLDLYTLYYIKLLVCVLGNLKPVSRERKKSSLQWGCSSGGISFSALMFNSRLRALKVEGHLLKHGERKLQGLVLQPRWVENQVKKKIWIP